MALTAEQLEMRRSGVTATDTVVLAGEGGSLKNPRSVLDVYNEKIGVAPPWEGNVATRIGEHLEPLILDLLAEEKELLLAPCDTRRHPIIPWELATPDRLVLGDRLPTSETETFILAPRTIIGVAEAKVVGYRMAHRWDKGPADSVVIQVTKQMLVTQTKRAHIVALFGTEPRFYEVELDETNLGPALLEMDQDFWENHVVPRVPPAPDASENAARALRQLYRQVKGGIVRATPEIDIAAREYFRAYEALERAQQELTFSENVIKAAIGAAEVIQGDGWAAQWRERRGNIQWRKVADTLLKATPKAEFEAFRGEGTRVFECKPIKEAR